MGKYLFFYLCRDKTRLKKARKDKYPHYAQLPLAFVLVKLVLIN